MYKTVHIVYFSATQNSKKYAAAVANGLGLPVVEHDMTGPGCPDKSLTVSRNEIMIFSAPVFAGRVPPLAVERFRRCKGNGGPGVVITTYGNRDYDDALLELADLAKELGFTLAGAAAPVGRHSLLPHLAAARPDAADLKEAAAFGRKILAKLQKTEPEQLPPLAVKGNSPYRQAPPSAPWLPYGDDSCNACLTCVQACPTGAIPAENPKSTGETCFRCGRCMAVCPQTARKIPAPVFAAMRERIDPLGAGHKESTWVL